jgi:PhnB protein
MITVHIIVDDADAASAWYRDVFGAIERSRIVLPDGKLIHVDVDVDGTTMMLADEFPDHDAFSPATTGHTSAVFYVECDNVDDVWARAMAGGATVVRPLADVFWGEREGQIIDPFGHRWGLTQHIRDVSLDEMTVMAAQVFGRTSAS